MLRAILPDPGIDIVASPLARAFETATIIAGELGRAASDVRTDERINDFDVGVLAGYPGWDAVASDFPELARLRLEDPSHFQPPGGESGADVLARAEEFLAAREAAGTDTLVVCHGVINKFIRAAAQGITGGVVGDVAGFAAALFMRGIDLVQIPTTLMSQVDSAVGGKNAINTRYGKNLVGTFHQPKLVLNDVSVLRSLPRRELLSGYGEVVKCGLIRGEREFRWLEDQASALLAFETDPLIEAVRMGCETKARIVTADERDRGDRALVNLGHTFAHAIEAEAGYGVLPHGEAVAAGLAASASLSAKLGHCDPSLVERVRSHLRSTGLPDRIAALASNRTWNPGAILGHMAHDKKTVDGRVHFVLLRGVGTPFVDGTVPGSVVLDVLRGECRQG